MQSQSNSVPRSHRNDYYNSHEQQQEEEGLFPMIQKMIFYLKQQQLSPALLAFKQEVFAKLQQGLKQQEDKLKQYKKDPDADTTTSIRNYKTVIYSMEIEKISFVLKHYLKIRLDKIQKCSFYYFRNMSIAESLMSKPQLEFLKKYVDLRYKYYETNIFKHLNRSFKGVAGMQMFLGKNEEKKFLTTNQSNSNAVEPDMKSYVFVKMNRNPSEFRYKTDMPIYDVPAEESQIASPNDILFIPYQVAKQLMDRSGSEDLELI